MDKEKLKTFIRLLQKVKKQPSQTFDFGLIVKEPKSKISSDGILKAAKKIIDIEKIAYDKSSIDEGVMENLVNVFKKGKWVFLEIKKDISSPLLNQLKHLANFNSFQLLDYKGKDIFEIKMPENSRVIVFAERDFIENKVSYPHFYRLFGPTLSIK
jgi:hypothetical protein